MMIQEGMKELHMLRIFLSIMHLHNQFCIKSMEQVCFFIHLSFYLSLLPSFSLLFLSFLFLNHFFTYLVIQETGHKTRGHTCLTPEDKDCSKSIKGSLLYGELLPRGLNKALGAKHLNAATARSLFDLGSLSPDLSLSVL